MQLLQVFPNVLMIDLYNLTSFANQALGNLGNSVISSIKYRLNELRADNTTQYRND